MSEALSTFDAATTVDAAGPDRWEVELDPVWTIGGRPHGGYLLALLARAADGARRAGERVNDHPHPVATSAQFLRSPVVGPADIRTELLRVGRSITQLRATMHQGDHDLVHALFTFGQLHDEAPTIQVDDPRPAITPFEDCPTVQPQPEGAPIVVGIAETVDLRLDPTAVPAIGDGAPDLDRPERPAVLVGHLAFRDGRPPDPLSLLFSVDAPPPATFAVGLFGWVPTLELSVYVRGLPAPGPLTFRQRARLMRDGLIDELCDIWDADGRLVAQASQLAAFRMPG